MKIQALPHWLEQTLIEPNAKNEDDRRRAYIFHILINGTIALSVLALASSAITKITRNTHYDAVPLVMLAAFTVFFAALLYLSKKGYYRYAAFIYIVAFSLIAIYPIVLWGILLPQGILTLCLIIVMAGVLLSARASFVMTLLITLALLLIEHLAIRGVVHFETDWMREIGGYNDVIVYGITFSIVALVAWLSNRQIEQALRRAQASEKALRRERNQLEVRVRQRTKELERVQVEKLEELNRFAEFGRISSTLLHELANPLTSASLNLELMKNKRTSKLYDQVHESIAYMEEYVASARRQLRSQSEIGEFQVSKEIRRVTGFLRSQARAAKVEINTVLDDSLTLTGDSVKFNQILSNLLVNAIDAYENISPTARTRRPIRIVTKHKAKMVEVVITDYGIGIPRQDIPHIFEAFYSTKTSERGTGLGLTITRRTVEEDFAGTISATSSKQYGTQFRLRIPLS